MALDTPASIAVLGAGPIGLEAALYARFLGYDVQITTLFQYSTIAMLAEHLEGKSKAAAADEGRQVGPSDRSGAAPPDDVNDQARRRRDAIARRKPLGTS